ncbi:hypothetical protein SERPOUNCE_12 [Bacillus phage SerPounce]|uniref:Uncharacterized protein n=1 Tax=Bacillus phage SerPounce TaxID=1983413 RepID=A0A1X9SHN3_9CAUD|nr:hypothetical protein H3011_gp12 [Bacillus phage SerPounce]ARQ95547.1 hypothetical protein SERPOUNCE_12 [Bacillus phage SerPounce]
MKLTKEIFELIFNGGMNARFYDNESWDGLSDDLKDILKELKISEKEWNERLL